MSLRQTPPHTPPLPAARVGFPYRALLATALGENRLVTVTGQASLYALLGTRALRLLDLGMIGAMFAVDRDEGEGLPANPRATAAHRAAWGAVQGDSDLMSASTREQASDIRGDVLFVGFAHSEVPAWFRRTSSDHGLDDLEALSIEFLLADPTGWQAHNELPF